MMSVEDLAYTLPVIENPDDLIAAWWRHGSDDSLSWYIHERAEALFAAGVILQDQDENEAIIPSISTTADILPAIEVAREYPEARWYVERRIQALGVEAEYQLPWSPDA